MAYRINGELVSPTEGLLNALMLLYADDLFDSTRGGKALLKLGWYEDLSLHHLMF